MKLLRRWLPVAVWCGVIFLFSSWETPPSPQDTLLNFLLKKTAHLIEYAVLYFLTFRAINYSIGWRAKGPRSSTRSLSIVGTRTSERGRARQDPNRYLYPLLFTILYAISDEIHQSFVSGRHGRTADVLIDAAGALLAWLKIKTSDS